MSVEDRGHLLTEQLDATRPPLDALSIEDGLERLAEEDARAVAAVEAARPALAAAVRLFTRVLGANGRILAVGAGTSGRLATLDFSELPPTFGADPGQFVAAIAGGPTALTRAVEGAEDDAEAGARAVRDLDLGPGDACLGVAAGGTTPYVHGALDEARARGAGTVFMACVSEDQVPSTADVSIRLLCGPEPVQGSTRMKAGTATKLALNALSTLAMVQLGKVHGGRMVDVDTRANVKLVDRGLRLVSELGPVSRERAAELLEAAEGHVKTAVAMAWLDTDASEARHALDAVEGHLGRLPREDQGCS